MYWPFKSKITNYDETSIQFSGWRPDNERDPWYLDGMLVYSDEGLERILSVEDGDRVVVPPYDCDWERNGKEIKDWNKEVIGIAMDYAAVH